MNSCQLLPPQVYYSCRENPAEGKLFPLARAKRWGHSAEVPNVK